MKKLKILTVVGTRPEIIRLSRVLALLDEHCEHLLVHTGQNYDYELNQANFAFHVRDIRSVDKSLAQLHRVLDEVLQIKHANEDR